MTLSQLIDHIAKLVTVRGTDNSVVRDAEDLAAVLLGDGSIGRDYALLLVVPALAREHGDSIAELTALLRMVRARIRGPVAIVTSGTGQALPANLVALMTELPGQPVRAFLDEAGARAWIAECGKLGSSPA